ncbi:MAG: PD-(D/E)XK nuclease family protein [Bacteroidetes bacterium]|nr:PD-(D/E)XK nuclease family protein [Bacteroidota bacterium]
MAQPFLKSIANYVFQNYKDKIENLCIVLPNKRGALFLKNYLAQSFQKTIWLPTIISAEELVAELSELKTLEEIDLICHLYESYKACYGAKAEPFDSFAKWGQLILQDFNEIDRYLASSEQLYENLKNIKEIENWSLGAETLSEYQTNYLQFMNSLGAIYKHFSAFLIANNWAYQGLAYREAVKKLQTSAYPNQFHKLLFCGFNALNAAELKIFNHFHTSGKAELLWDADDYYLHDKNQEAGLFLRQNFELFKQREPLFIEHNFKQAKEIKIVSVPKQIGQAQVVKQTLQKLIDQNIPLDKVAVVLANEKLLAPVLHQLPSGVQHVNITMEYPLKYTATYGWIDLLLQIQYNFSKQQKTKTIYHKDFVGLLRQPLFQNYLRAKNIKTNPQKIIREVAKRNVSFISSKHLQAWFEDDFSSIQNLLQPAANTQTLCTLFIELLQTLIDFFFQQKHSNQVNLELEYLQIILKNFNRLSEILSRYPHFNDIQSFRQLYMQVVGNASAPFIGEPLQGLQIMGVLETRTLDFEHVILVNVNESVLPSGKTINSFIPNDLKRAFGLPLYLEKDAIYAYHFYRLLQRAADITITYDSETDTLGKGEKSRFVTQLQLEMVQYNSDIKITEEVAAYTSFPETTENKICIHKNENVLKNILEKSLSDEEYKGLSPSALATFKECGLKFYFRYGAQLKETEEVEESAEANTFGSILHESLETLYKNFVEKVISYDELHAQEKEIENVVNEKFASYFGGQSPTGKSLLQQEVIKVYVKKLLQNDLRFISALKEKNQVLTLNALEQEFSAPLQINIGGQPKTVYIKGKMDRIDTFGGIVRVIDYKSSVKQSDKFYFETFEDVFTDKNYNKQSQLLIYAWLLYKNNVREAEKLQPCIIPFKVFNEEPKYILSKDKKPFQFTKEFLNDFENELRRFVETIFDASQSFEQSEDKDVHQYCAYKSICNL